MNTIYVTELEAGERLDKALSAMYPDYSRSALEKLIETGQVLVNGLVVKTKRKLRLDDEITVNFNELTRAVDEIELPVIYEDENIVVIDKPIGVLSHSKGTFNKEGTVATWLKQHVTGVAPKGSDVPNVILEGAQELNFWDSNRAGIVHRLDRGTSGVMICAKNEATVSHLGKQFSERNVKKTYVAVIKGELSIPEGKIDVPIERNPKKPATFRAGINGKVAQTYFKTTQTNGKYSLVELNPKTGRTHQLRVHLDYLKHPIVGDEFYKGETAERLMLHAAKLEITIPTSKRVTFEAPVPEIFNTLTS